MVTVDNLAAIVRDELEAMKERIIVNHTDAGQVATGKTAASLTVDIEQDDEGVTGTVYGAGYFAVLETGSQPWAQPHMKAKKDGSSYPSAPKWFIDVIANWAAAKGIDIGNPWGVATKIMTQGSKLFRERGRADIFTPEIESAVENISQRLGDYFDVELVDSLLRE